jgi:hypothetical protein
MADGLHDVADRHTALVRDAPVAQRGHRRVDDLLTQPALVLVELRSIDQLADPNGQLHVQHAHLRRSALGDERRVLDRAQRAGGAVYCNQDCRHD